MPDSAKRTHQMPKWLTDIESSVGIRSQFLISGNTHDTHLARAGDEAAFLPTLDAIWQVLAARGVSALFVFDPVDGLRLHDACKPLPDEVMARLGIGKAGRDLSIDGLLETLRHVSAERSHSLALVVDYASQLLDGIRGDERALSDFFVSIDKISRRPPLKRERGTATLPWNPIFWIVNRPGDLPDWFATANAAVRTVTIEMPDQHERFHFARWLADRAAALSSRHPFPAADDVEQFALETEGMTLAEMGQVVALAAAAGNPFASVSEAIRAYHSGTPRNPWRSDLMRARISNGEAILTNRVKGQRTAVRKALDILVRSYMGLSGSQTSRPHNRPRGILFFAGPTGVGKTELAKSVTELLFGDETAYHRFDMSEFINEASETRLIGAPPGSQGHESGGELVNAVRNRPFSVFLFDEIEKAHPRILDIFLQIIDEGRLTDARGETGHFSELLIIFTSNVGIMGGERETNMGLNVLPSDHHDALEAKIVKGIRDHFRYKLQRPELMNRLGRNIIVFDFINTTSASAIFDVIVGRVLETLRAERQIRVELSSRARRQLEDICTHDLFDGGRGIANRIEANFINPLARYLFDEARSDHVLIDVVEQTEDGVRLLVGE